MGAKAIRYWLMKRPRPATVKVIVGKEISEMQFDARTSFARTAETLDAMDADRLEALDLERKLIRACKPAEMEDADDAPEPEPEAEPPPAGAVVTDPETARFVLVANLVAEAYRHSNEVAFSRLADIVDRMTRRTESTERSIDHLRRMLIQEAEEKFETAAEREPGLLEQLAGAFAGGANIGSAGAPAEAPAPKPNGKGH
jgi:hypothetical protein